MRKVSPSESGAFNPRLFLAFTLCCFGGLLAVISFASTPSTGTLTDVSGPLRYTAGPFNQPNPTPVIEVDNGPRCNGQFPCDSYALSVNVPAAYLTSNPNASVKVTMSWTDGGTGNSDYDLYVFKGMVANTNGARAAEYKSASSGNPEVAVIFPLVAGPQQYTVKIVPFTPGGEIVNVLIELQAGAPGGGGGGGGGFVGPFGGPTPTVPGAPRFQNFFAPAGSSGESSSGEFNIGFDPKTNRIMAMNAGPILRITPGEVQSPAKPECCEALWEDRSAPNTTIGLDPVLFTDQKTGRTFASNSTAGANGAYAFTDAAPPFNDGDQWVPVGAAPPSGADHQTIGTGPYPSALAALGNAVNQGQYVLYCSQDLIGSLCQRSDDLGPSFGPGVPATGPGTMNSQGCGGLHGHVRIAPDGTAWLPDNSCDGNVQGGAISLDAGSTPWTEFVVKKTVADAEGPAFTAASQTNGADPSIALDSASTAYFCYVNNQPGGTEGHAHVAVGKRTGSTIQWIRDTDVGIAQGVINAAHTEAIAGDAGRAACGFYGTNVAGNYESGTFAGVWYAFIATTYDEGRTWVTVNATPNDPVQRATGIWQQGGDGENGDRNLLDFNEITLDSKGRVLYGYSDGCHSAACIGGTPGDRGAYMRVARQFGGKTLFASQDIAEPVAPKPACLSGTRDSTGSSLTWKAPDNGGSDIINYEIWRSTTAGTEVLIATTADAKTTYKDTTADPAVPLYYYYVKAINTPGTGPQSNEINLPLGVAPPVENRCVLPGITIADDPAGDNLDAPNTQHDLRKLSIAQLNDGANPNNKLFITIKVGDLNPTPEPLGRWSMNFTRKKPAPATGTTDWFVAMQTDDTASPGTPVYRYGHFTVGTGGVKSLVTDGIADSGTESVDGTILITISTPTRTNTTTTGANAGLDFPALQTGETLTNVNATVQQSSGALLSTVDSTGNGAYTVVPNNTCSSLVGVVSRKTHASAGDFDIDLPLAGNPGIESRRGGATNAYKLVFTLDRTVTVPGTATTSQNGATATTASGPNPNQVTVNLTGVNDIQRLVVTLNGVQGSLGPVLNNLAVPMDVLVGDSNRDGTVNSGDAQQTRNRSGQLADPTNFRSDVNADGTVNSGDAFIVRANSSHQIAP